MVQVLDPVITPVPNATDYSNDYVEVTGASGLRVRVKANSTTGMILKIRCPDATLADRISPTWSCGRRPRPARAASTMASYTAITGVDQNLWSTGTSQGAWATVTTDVRVQNLFNYNDAVGGGTTSYSNTLTYTVVAQ